MINNSWRLSINLCLILGHFRTRLVFCVRGGELTSGSDCRPMALELWLALYATIIKSHGGFPFLYLEPEQVGE